MVSFDPGIRNLFACAFSSTRAGSNDVEMLQLPELSHGGTEGGNLSLFSIITHGRKEGRENDSMRSNMVK